MKTWCEDIVWWPAEDGLPGAWVSRFFDINGSRDIPKEWTCCPICKTDRPKPTTKKVRRK